jgi:hypothetical protein
MDQNEMEVAEFLANLPDERREAMTALRQAVRERLPDGFQERVDKGFLNWSVPHSTYPAGYHCNPKDPLPFLALANQKHSINLYHMGIYADPELYAWFTTEYAKQVKTKLDMGKSCVRFKKPEHIPLALVGELASKMTPADWIVRYEAVLKKR